MDGSDSSSLSEHSDVEIMKLAPVFLKAKAATKMKFPPPKFSPPKPKRPPSPPHEEVLADNPDIAFIVMFRSRFNDAMPSKLPNYGPQDIERGVVDSSPTPEVSQLLCALLGLVLNRKKPPERGHHGRALEEAVSNHRREWPKSWNDINPLHGGKNFENMTPTERLNLLRTLIMWALNNSEVIQATIKDKYKQSRHNDDENQALSVQPWGVDGDKRRYFLVQGLDDTSFRVYREARRYGKTPEFWSVAGTIDEVKELAKKLEEVDGSQAARRLANKITNAIPTFEATEEKRRRREYRQIHRARFTRPEPGFSLYEGRTRGKRMRYTYDDDEDIFDSDATSTRRSTRVSSRNTPFDSGPTFTASGRQVRQPRTGEYGESLLSAGPINSDELGPSLSDVERSSSRRRSVATTDSEEPVRAGGRPTRAAAKPMVNGAASRKRKHIDTYNSIDEMSDEEDAGASGDEWDSDQNERDDEELPDADDEASEAEEESDIEDEEPQSLILKLKVPTKALMAMEAGILSPRSTTSDHHSTQAGALKNEAQDEPVVMNGITSNHTTDAQIHVAPSQPQQHRNSSPLGSSAYPTPTSSSFIPAEQKISAISAPSVPAPPFQQFFASHGDAFQVAK